MSSWECEHQINSPPQLIEIFRIVVHYIWCRLMLWLVEWGWLSMHFMRQENYLMTALRYFVAGANCEGWWQDTNHGQSMLSLEFNIWHDCKSTPVDSVTQYLVMGRGREERREGEQRLLRGREGGRPGEGSQFWPATLIITWQVTILKVYCSLAMLWSRYCAYPAQFCKPCNFEKGGIKYCSVRNELLALVLQLGWLGPPSTCLVVTSNAL